MITFDKYHGTGNDFIIIDMRDKLISLDKEVIALMCDRRFGIGADGLILLENHDDSDFFMRYYNSNGIESSMCGNGGRCIIAFAKAKGIISSKTIFTAIDGLHSGIVLGQDGGEWNISLQMSDVPGIRDDEGHYELNTGSPHYVAFIQNINEPGFVEKARKIRYNDKYAGEGINVNFATIENGLLYVRSYERGVEDETLSCGTGVTAVAIAAAVKSGRYGKYETEISSRGGNLKVSFYYDTNGVQDVWLEGPARFVYSGKINTEKIS